MLDGHARHRPMSTRGQSHESRQGASQGSSRSRHGQVLLGERHAAERLVDCHALSCEHGCSMQSSASERSMDRWPCEYRACRWLEGQRRGLASMWLHRNHDIVQQRTTAQKDEQIAA